MSCANSIAKVSGSTLRHFSQHADGDAVEGGRRERVDELRVAAHGRMGEGLMAVRAYPIRTGWVSFVMVKIGAPSVRWKRSSPP